MTGTAFITSATVAKWDAAKRVNFAEHVAAKARRLMLPKNSCSFLGQGSVVHTRHAHWTSRCVMRATVFLNALRSPDNLSDVILFYVHPFLARKCALSRIGTACVRCVVTIAPTCHAGTSHMLTRVEISVFCGLLHYEGG